MRTQKELEDAIADIQSKIAGLEDEKKAMLDEWAELSCPHKIGFIVPCGGYSHRGKPVIIGRIGWTLNYGSKPRWIVSGKLMKKDGTPSLISVNWRQGFD